MDGIRNTIASQVCADRRRLTPAIDSWIISMASRLDWRTPPQDRGRDRLRVLGRYVACCAARNVPAVPEDYDTQIADPGDCARNLYRALFPDDPAAADNMVHYRMRQIGAASADFATMEPDRFARIPTPGSICEMRHVALREEMIREADWILLEIWPDRLAGNTEPGAQCCEKYSGTCGPG